jgi:hypothetical protein
MDPDVPGRMSCWLVEQTEGLLSVKPGRGNIVSYYPKIYDSLSIVLP